MENLFLLLLKKNPSEFLVEQRAKSNEQRAESREQRAMREKFHLILFLLYSNDLLKYKNCVIKTCLQRGKKCNLKRKISFEKKNLKLSQK